MNSLFTPITPEQLRVLVADLNPARVEKRSQGGANLSYLAAYDVKATLIRLFGYAGFSAETLRSDIIDTERTDDGKIKVTAISTVRLTIHQTGAVYTDSAVSTQTGRVLGDVADFAIKTSSSDALKRAAIHLGTAFGLSLYDNGSTRDVVRVVMAPDQQWPPQTSEAGESPAQGAREGTPPASESPLSNHNIKTAEDAERVLAESLGAKPVAE